MNTHPNFPDLFFIFSHRFLETQRVYTGLEERIRRHIPSGRIWEASAECMKFLRYLDVLDPTFIRGVEITEHRI